MASNIDICSNALLMLGSKPIASFTEADTTSNLDRARLCANLYPMWRLAMLRDHTWNCCTKRVVLSPDSTPPAFGYANRFLKPGDWVRTLQVGRDERCPTDYRAEGNYLLSDESVVYLAYSADVIESLWDDLLVYCMTLKMAAVLAYPITASSTEAQTRTQIFEAEMRKAKAVDGQDEPPQTLGTGQLLQSRFGGYAWNNG